MNPDSKRRFRKIGLVALSAVAFLTVGIWMFVRSNPLIFNESFLEHAHCMKQTTSLLQMYAHDHNGKFPSHTNGYVDALMLMESQWPLLFTGPGYDIAPVITAWKAGQDIPETELGRVYVQGLDDKDDANIAIVFDKLPTPGGDHCHGLSRLRAPLVREVGLIDGSMERILEKDWPKFSRKQIDLLVTAGIPKEKAEAYYSEQPKPELAALAKKYSNR